MMETKWTPGPWMDHANDQGGYGENAYVCVDDGSDVVARVRCYTARGLNRKPYEANAHLIAAAPELYEALEDATALAAAITASNVRINGQYINVREAVSRARAALAKARGE